MRGWRVASRSISISLNGGPKDRFTGTRWLGSAALVGRFDAGIVRIEPKAQLSAMTETTAAYVDHNGNRVDPVTATAATLELGPRLSLVSEQPNGFTPYLGLSTIWSFLNTQSSGATLINSSPPLRGRVEAGATVGSPGEMSARAGAYYDGLGGKWSAWGLSLALDATLQWLRFRTAPRSAPAQNCTIFRSIFTS